VFFLCNAEASIRDKRIDSLTHASTRLLNAFASSASFHRTSPSEGLARQRIYFATVRGTGSACIAQASRIDDANAGATPLQPEITPRNGDFFVKENLFASTSSSMRAELTGFQRDLSLRCGFN
jgi:hypothetical protein